MKKIIIGMILLLGFTHIVLAATDSLGEVFQVDYDVQFQGGPINQRVDYPLLSYQDRTYISVRDMAKFMQQEVVWNEANNRVWIIPPEQENVVQTEETARKIAKAVMEEKFADKITADTKYSVTHQVPECLECEESFLIYIIFDGKAADGSEFADEEEIRLNDAMEAADVEMYLWCRTGKIDIKQLTL